jgi:hypothetical protein
MCVQDKYWEVGKAIMTTFRDYGYRYNPRTKCRLMYLINDMGMEVFFSQKAPFPIFKVLYLADLQSEHTSPLISQNLCKAFLLKSQLHTASLFLVTLCSSKCTSSFYTN